MYSRESTLLVSASAAILNHEVLTEGHHDLSPELLHFLGLREKEVGAEIARARLRAQVALIYRHHLDQLHHHRDHLHYHRHHHHHHHPPPPLLSPATTTTTE